MTIYFYQFSNEKQKQCFFSKTRFAKFDKIKAYYKIQATKESNCEIEINYTTILILYRIKCAPNIHVYDKSYYLLRIPTSFAGSLSNNHVDGYENVT